MSVRCSYCYNHGHNKRGCPDYKARMDSLRAVNPNDYRVLDYDRKKASASRSSSHAKCSWCGVNGHDRRKCDSYADSRAKTKALQSEMRNWFKDRCQEAGIGIGTVVVEHKNPDYSTHPTDVYVLNRFDLAAMTVSEAASFYDSEYYSGCHYKTISRDTWNDAGISLRRLMFNLPPTYYNNAIDVIPAADNSRLSKDLPADWLNGEAGLEAIFKATTSRRGLRASSFGDYYTSWSNGFDRIKQQFVNDCADPSISRRKAS